MNPFVLVIVYLRIRHMCLWSIGVFCWFCNEDTSCTTLLEVLPWPFYAIFSTFLIDLRKYNNNKTIVSLCFKFYLPLSNVLAPFEWIPAVRHNRIFMIKNATQPGCYFTFPGNVKVHFMVLLVFIFTSWTR